jgi:predicted ester cyclase
MDNPVIRQYYECFNRRRFDEAAALFMPDAVVERMCAEQGRRGAPAYRAFVDAWVAAFPDARLAIERVQGRGDSLCEVELLATGTHQGTLDLGSGGAFRPSGAHTTIHMRELLEIRQDRITYSSLSLDFQDLIRQLVVVDYSALTAHLAKIRALSDQLASERDDPERQRDITTRLGQELDAARHVLRPYYRR